MAGLHFFSTDWTRETCLSWNRIVRQLLQVSALFEYVRQLCTSLVLWKKGTHGAISPIVTPKNNKTLFTLWNTVWLNYFGDLYTPVPPQVRGPGVKTPPRHTLIVFAAEPVFGRSNFDCKYTAFMTWGSISPLTAQVFSYWCGKRNRRLYLCFVPVLFGVRRKHRFFCRLPSLSALWLSFSGRSEAGFGSVGWQV